MKKLLLIAVSLVAFSAHANFYEGNDLKKWSMALTKSNLGNRMSAQEQIEASMFQGYIAGAFEVGEGVLFCIKDRTRLIQLTDTVTNYVNSNPEKLNDTAANVIFDALTASFPCKK